MSRPQTLTRPQPPVRFAQRPREDPACKAPRHGTYTAYQGSGCRCPAAREDWRLYDKRRRQGRAPQQVVDATGARRRLQALATLGWPQARLADELGYANQESVGRILRGRTNRVNVRTNEAVAALYDRLSMTPGPSDRARDYARQAGWVPPLDWDDDNLDDPTAASSAAADDPTAAPTAGADDQDDVDPVAVQRACEGDRVNLNRAERDEVVARLVAAGRSVNAIAGQLGMSDRHVQRIKSQLASPPAADAASPPDLGQVSAKVQQAREAVARRTRREATAPAPDLPPTTHHTERSTPCLTR